MRKLEYDLYYVKNHTLFLDLLILFETVRVVLLGRGRALAAARAGPAGLGAAGRSPGPTGSGTAPSLRDPARWAAAFARGRTSGIESSTVHDSHGRP